MANLVEMQWCSIIPCNLVQSLNIITNFRVLKFPNRELYGQKNRFKSNSEHLQSISMLLEILIIFMESGKSLCVISRLKHMTINLVVWNH
jgi:hypothetical protein